MRFSHIEVRDITKAWLAISVAFAIVLTRGNLFSINLILNFILSALTVGVGFLLHELAHKYMAQKYRCWSEFRAFDNMLILAILMSFLGFVFAAPGAVFIQGSVNVRKNGKISVAGPLTNLILALIFLPITFFTIGYIQKIATYGFMINTWLALFNMIPVWQFDGAKVLRWNKYVYFLVVIVAFVLMSFVF